MRLMSDFLTAVEAKDITEKALQTEEIIRKRTIENFWTEKVQPVIKARSANGYFNCDINLDTQKFPFQKKPYMVELFKLGEALGYTYRTRRNCHEDTIYVLSWQGDISTP
jgi:hypothetical protein